MQQGKLLFCHICRREREGDGIFTEAVLGQILRWAQWWFVVFMLV